MYELKPCPFCGSEAEIVVASYHGRDIFGVQCPRCGVKTEQNYIAKVGAIGAWNRRVDEKYGY